MVQLTFNLEDEKAERPDSKGDISEIIFNEAQRLYDSRRFKEALTFINVSIEHKDDKYQYHHLKGKILQSLRRFEDSNRAFDDALNHNVTDEILISKADMLYDWANSINDKNRALEIITDALTIFSEVTCDVDTEKLWYLKGSILDCLGDAVESRRCYLIAEGFHDEISELDRQAEILKSSNETLICISGTRFYFGLEPFRPGITVDLIKEDDNEHDPDAIRVEIEGETVGYVANSEYTLINGVKSASDLKGIKSKTAEILFIYMDEHVIAKVTS